MGDGKASRIIRLCMKQQITAGFDAKVKNGGNKPFAGRVVSDLYPVYTFKVNYPMKIMIPRLSAIRG